MSKKKIRGVKTPSRRKFFKVAAATGAAAAAQLQCLTLHLVLLRL